MIISSSENSFTRNSTQTYGDKNPLDIYNRMNKLSNEQVVLLRDIIYNKVVVKNQEKNNLSFDFDNLNKELDTLEVWDIYESLLDLGQKDVDIILEKQKQDKQEKLEKNR